MTDKVVDAASRDFMLPDLGEGLVEAEIVQWLVQPGERIELNQPIVEMETDKALVEIPARIIVGLFGGHDTTCRCGPAWARTRNRRIMSPLL